MKKKIILLTVLAGVGLTLAGCRQPLENSTPAATNSAGNQPPPGAAVSNNVTTPPAFNWNNTNNPTGTNQ